MKLLIVLLAFIKYKIYWASEWAYGYQKGFPGSSAGKESACNAGDPGLSPGLGRSPGEGIG